MKYANKKVYLSEPGDTHGSLCIQHNLNGVDRIYDGRIWLKSKIISFWIYPPKAMMVTFIYKLEKAFREQYHKDIDILGDPDFKIEVYNKNENDLQSSSYIIVPLHKYIGSANPKRIEHIISPLLKQKKTPEGFGSKSSKYKPLAWRQAMYVEGLNEEEFKYFKGPSREKIEKRLERLSLKQKFIEGIKNRLDWLVKDCIDKGIDPSTTLHPNASSKDNWAIWQACFNNDIKTFNILINDERVNPSVEDNVCLWWANNLKNKEMIKKLLKDSRVLGKLSSEEKLLYEKKGLL
jgi:hypothetical protein